MSQASISRYMQRLPRSPAGAAVASFIDNVLERVISEEPLSDEDKPVVDRIRRILRSRGSPLAIEMRASTVAKQRDTFQDLLGIDDSATSSMADVLGDYFGYYRQQSGRVTRFFLQIANDIQSSLCTFEARFANRSVSWTLRGVALSINRTIFMIGNAAS